MRKMIFLAIAGAIACGSMALTGCNVTRVITNESQYLQKGDTSIVIQTKTVESYNAEKRL